MFFDTSVSKVYVLSVTLASFVHERENLEACLALHSSIGIGGEWCGRVNIENYFNFRFILILGYLLGY